MPLPETFEVFLEPLTWQEFGFTRGRTPPCGWII